MPNHVRNRLIIKAEEAKVKEITHFLMGEPKEDGNPCYIDFNNIFPMPKTLLIESSSRGEMGEAILNKKACFGMTYTEIKERFDALEPEKQEEYLKIGRQYQLNREKYGHTTWYEWAIENWGTKWNAYNQQKLSDNEIWFDTAWSCVVQLIGKLAKKFPDAVFDYTWADEDTGDNCGQVIIKNKKTLASIPESCSREAYELAFEMRPELREDYIFEDGNYRYCK